jgi:hypothetical protein
VEYFRTFYIILDPSIGGAVLANYLFIFIKNNLCTPEPPPLKM